MGRRDRLIRAHLRTRFVVTLKSGAAFDGLLVEADERTLVLADAWTVDPGGRQSVDGRLFVPRVDVEFMQLPSYVPGVVEQ